MAYKFKKGDIIRHIQYPGFLLDEVVHARQGVYTLRMVNFGANEAKYEAVVGAKAIEFVYVKVGTIEDKLWRVLYGP